MSETPLHPWSIVEKNGNILCAHCNCKAGIGECCSHVDTLFYIEFRFEFYCEFEWFKKVRRRNTYWLLPGYKKVECKPVADIDFTSANTIYQNMKKEATKSGAHKNNPPRKTTRKPTDDEISAYYEKLCKCSKKPAILSIVPGYTKSFEPSLLNSSYSP